MSAAAPCAFAVWITGPPASGKTTLALALQEELRARGVDAAILDSDELRRVLTPSPRYDASERALLYARIVSLTRRLVLRGTPVIVAATAHLRAWRDAARAQVGSFVEVHAACPLEVCAARDPKGIYRRAALGASGPVPGLHVPYEPPAHPEVTVRTDRESPAHAARRIAAVLARKGLAPRARRRQAGSSSRARR